MVLILVIGAFVILFALRLLSHDIQTLQQASNYLLLQT